MDLINRNAAHIHREMQGQIENQLREKFPTDELLIEAAWGGMQIGITTSASETRIRDFMMLFIQNVWLHFADGPRSVEDDLYESEVPLWERE